MHESSGLRFDIYERVHLPQEAADIREIEELELTPCVQAERQGDQVVLRGSLLLGGVYLPDDESRDSRQLEHWIPVEITLPPERVSRIEDLAVEVDNFDADLPDKRTLNITGVLTLKGVKAATAGSEQQAYAWGEEPYTVVHRRGRELIGDSAAESDAVSAGETAQSAGEDEPFVEASADAAPSWDESAEPEREEAEWRSAGNPETIGADGDGADVAAVSGDESNAERAGDDSGEERELEGDPVVSAGPLEWKTFAAQTAENLSADAEDLARQSGEAADEPGSGSDTGQGVSGAGAALFESEPAPAGDPSDASRVSEQEDVQLPQDAVTTAAAWSGEGGNAQADSGKSELRVAFGAKRDDGPSGAEGATGLGKLFFPDRRDARGEAGAKALEASEPSRDQEAAEAGYRKSLSSSDEVDWRSLFRGAAAQETFRTVRLCIVQKDDTLDAIADRYQRNPREIALANRLDGSSVTEGQVLLIP